MKYHLLKYQITCLITAGFINRAAIRILLITTLSALSFFSRAQTPDTNKLVIPILRDTSKNSNAAAEYLTIKQCIDYALVHQPALNQSLINIEITRATNAINLATALPQVNVNGSAIHNIQQSNYGGTAVTTGSGTTTGTTTTSNRSGATNTFIPELTVSQTIFNPSLLYAARSAPLLVKQAQQVTDSTKIYLVSAVSKSFYNVLLTLEQINVLKEDTARLGKNLRDAYLFIVPAFIQNIAALVVRQDLDGNVERFWVTAFPASHA